jgi:hypothetical protein
MYAKLVSYIGNRREDGNVDFNLLKPSGFFPYHKVNIQKFYMVLASR